VSNYISQKLSIWASFVMITHNVIQPGEGGLSEP